MRLVVLDTNVLVSAAIRPDSIPATIISEWVLDRLVQVVTCPTIIDEYIEVMSRPKFTRYGFPPPWLELMIEQSLCLPEPPPWPIPGPDPNDEIFLALAGVSGAWLVTGNLKHYPESGRDGVTVLSPAEYLTSLVSDSR